MFDVRPTRQDGSLDLEKIRGVQRIIIVPEKKRVERDSSQYKKVADIKAGTDIYPVPPIHSLRATEGSGVKLMVRGEFEREIPSEKPRRANIVQLGKIVSDDFIPRIPEDSEIFANYELPEEVEKSTEDIIGSLKTKRLRSERKKKYKREKYLNAETRPFLEKIIPRLKFSYASSFAGVLIIFSLIVPAAGLIEKGFDTKTSLLKNSQEALGQFVQAKDNLASGKFDSAAVNFEQSYEILNEAKNEIGRIGGGFSEILRFVPGISKLASANYVISAGENLALAGKKISESAKILASLENPLGQNEKNSPALTDVFLNLRNGIRESSDELDQAEENISKVNMDDLPEEMKPQFLELKEKLPAINASLRNFLDYSQIFLDVLGYNGPRKFLFLFQNNQEMRATGGFIGSYGILDISNGRVKKLFVDDIYNPDGQLKARIIPPEPIQKMSAVWTMHDANWFPDFPTSAEKVSWFYEKTGGPTVDGVIAMTPNVIQDLLEITGPIEMPEYDTTVDAKNFIEKTQYEVEVDYDKKENQPKKFIADLMPKILDEVFNTKEALQMMHVLSVLDKSLNEKQLLLYSKNFNVQKLISEENWSGEILNTQKDYLSVVNTNINGFKTDGVIDETIEHQSEIQDDGSVVDTVSITRKHNGGNKEYNWWNKVNGDWLRVYVPEGSKLLEASGQTREFVSPPLDYKALGFKKDPQVEANENSTWVDEKTGTRAYDENHKTVFANWVYVSPGETVVVKYKYKLPFRLSFDALHHPADTFSVLYQKQSGSTGSRLISDINLPGKYRLIWKYPDYVESSRNSFHFETNLETDKFVGFAVENND